MYITEFLYIHCLFGDTCLLFGFKSVLTACSEAHDVATGKHEDRWALWDDENYDK